jgi:hypothetical protein
VNQVLQIPDHVARLRGLRSLAQDGQAGLAGSPVPYLSIKSSRFTAVDAVGNARPVGAMDARGMYLDVVIVDLNPSVSKTYYAEAFDPSSDDYKPPTCWSDNGTGPSHRVATPPAHTCASCPMNVWGSKISENGKEVKLCNDSKKIALLLADGTNIPFRLNIPPASLKPWKTHCQTVAANGADLTMLVSRLRFDPAATGPVLTFESISWVSPEQAVLIERTLADEKKLEALVGRDDVAKKFGEAIQVTQHVPAQQAPQVAYQPAPPGQQAPQGRAPSYQPPPLPQFMPPDQAPPLVEEVKPKRAPRAAKAPAPVHQAPPQQFMPATNRGGFMAGSQSAPVPQQGEVMPPVPSFLQRGPAPQAVPPPLATNFGMVQQPPATDSALDAAISLALNLGT